jgi:hypothetical protein
MAGMSDLVSMYVANHFFVLHDKNDGTPTRQKLIGTLNYLTFQIPEPFCFFLKKISESLLPSAIKIPQAPPLHLSCYIYPRSWKAPWTSADMAPTVRKAPSISPDIVPTNRDH